uniref:Uncharacterized protein n=1 Tax=Kalanchoe fedtschenkoi TaxID=63787 RepID=A0A7N0VIL0_KALFE
MGNFASCCIPDKTTKLFDADGNLKQLKMPITAAELMLEAPGHVVCSLDSMVKSRRIIALRADDELAVGGGVYMLVHVNRINCAVSELEIAMIQSACAKKLLSGVRSRGGSNKVLPVIERAAGSTALAVSTSGDGNGGRRNCSPRKWNPVLEPITEAC